MSGTNPAYARLNDGAAPLYLWLEPWAEEFDVPCGSLLELCLRGNPTESLEVDEAPDQITVWAPAGALVEVLIDGVVQPSASADLRVPAMGALSTKGFVEVAFGNFPEARPAGRPRPLKTGILAWLRNLFR